MDRDKAREEFEAIEREMETLGKSSASPEAETTLPVSNSADCAENVKAAASARAETADAMRAWPVMVRSFPLGVWRARFF